MNRSTDRRIVDSERNFNGSADPMITADRGFIQILGPDFGFSLFGSSDRGIPTSPWKAHFYGALLGSKLIMQTFLYHYFRIVTLVARLFNNEVCFDIF